jgi:hypothetical protein
MRFELRPTTLFMLTLALGASAGACDKSKKADTEVPGKEAGASAEVAGPETPTYETAVDEAKDLPNRLSAAVEWVAQPITDAATLAADLQSLKGSTGMDASQFSAMAKAAFTDGKVEISAEVEIDAEQRAQLEATLEKLASIGPALKSVPKRAKQATGDVLKLAVKAPTVARKAAKEIKGELKSADGEAKVKLEADLQEITAMPGKLKGEVGAAKTKILGLPKEAAAATAKLTASFAAG